VTAQDSAADPRRSAWVSANAGAGKTYTLANRVTRLLLDGAKPERILCLTYTKAAAAEMAGRLFEQLGQWSMAPDDALAARIAAIGAGTLAGEDLRRARRLFALALETPGGLKIQTIHSFCQYLLARFPLEAGVPPAFGVLDDGTARELREEARQRVLERAGGGEAQLADAASLLATETGEAQVHRIVTASLASDRRKLERFLARLADGGLAEAVARAHGAEPGDTPARITGEFLAEMKRDRSYLQEIAAWLSRGSANDLAQMARITAAVETETYEAFAGAFLTNAGTLRKSLATKGRARESPALFDRLSDLAAHFDTTEQRRRAAHAAALAHAALTIVEAAHAEYAAAKHLRGALDYDDLIAAAQRLLEHSDAAEWVLYKLDGGLDHVLIDEAQDTSPEQWSIVKRLTEEFFAGEGVDRGLAPPRTIFAVGDEKQSIFSFQGAEPREFDVHRRHFAARIEPAAFVDVRLDVSRRSAPEVLRFVDDVFAPPEARAGVVSGDAPIAHLAHRAEARGRVELWPLISPDDTPEPDIWRPVDAVSSLSPTARLATQIADCIRDWTDGRTCLPGKDHPIRPGDIMVLMPRREPFATAFIRALKLRGIPVAGADRIRLCEQMAVMDLIALGRFALLPEDDLNLAALLRSPFLGLSESGLFALCTAGSRTLWQALRASPDAQCMDAATFLLDALARADYAPPYEFYAATLAYPGTRRRLLGRLGAESADAIDEFLSLALSFEALNTPSLEGFLHWIEHGEAEVRRDMERGRNEVRVMTVHGAKGLEADIVILPDTASIPGGAGRHGDILYTDEGPVFPVGAEIAPEAVLRARALAEEKMREEHRRLLYVALTRARDRLYICGFKGKKALNPDSWYALVEQAAARIGVETARGSETMRTLGDGGFVPATGPARSEEASPALQPWMTRAAPGERAPLRLIRPSEAAEAEAPAVSSPAGARNAARFRRGNLVHALLAHLPELEPAARRAAAARYLSAQGVPADEAAALLDETLCVIEGRAFAAAFAPGARSEVSIVADLPELGRVTGRIDRLAVRAQDVLAIDYKTNRPPPAREADIPAVYVTQMALYRVALAKIFPGRSIACALLWTDGPSLMRLDDARLEAEADRLRERASQLR
jgi:ATP-dependent helicase/nuclease subunit A